MAKHAMRRVIVPMILSGCLWTSSSFQANRTLGSPPAESGADGALRDYLSANGLLNRGLFELAAAEYRKFLSDHAAHEKAPVARYGLGVCLFRMGQHEGAIAELKPLTGIADFAFLTEAETIIAQCLLALNRFEEAADAFAKAAGRGGDHPLADDAASGAIEALHRLGKNDAVIRQCEEFCTRWSDSPLRDRVQYFWGLAAIAKNDDAAAIVQLKALLEKHSQSPFAPHAELLLAQGYQRAGQTQDALGQFAAVLKRKDSAYAADALLAGGALLRVQKKLPQAGDMLDRLIEKFPQSRLIRRAKLERGLVSLDEEKFDAAAAQFESLAGEGGELSDEAAYWLGKCHFRRGRFADAAKVLGDAAKRFPKSRLAAECQYDQAVSVVRANEAEGAAALLKDFCSRYADHRLMADAMHLHALVEHQAKRFAESSALCQAFLSKFADHALLSEVMFLHGENEFLSERYTESVSRFREFLTKFTSDPKAVTAGYRIAIALYALERYDEAQPLLSKLAPLAAREEAYRPALLALGDIHLRRSEWKIAEQHLAAYLGGGSEFASADDALLKLAVCRQRQDRAAEALADYEKLIERFPASAHRTQAKFEKGQLLLVLEKHDLARAAFEEVAAEGTNTPFAAHALNHLANLAMRGNQFDKAADLFAKASAGGAGDADAMLGQAHALMSGKEFSQAEQALRSFVEREPSHTRCGEARAQLAIAIARQDRCGDALPAIEVARSAIGLDPALQSSLGYEKAWCLRLLDRVDEAIAAYRALTTEASGDIRLHAYLELGELEFNGKNFDAACEALTQLRGLLSSEADSEVKRGLREQAAYRLGLCEFERGKFEEAAKTLDEFASTFPESAQLPAAVFYTGESHFRLNRHEKAATALSRMTKDFAGHALSETAMLRLGESLGVLQRWTMSEETYREYLKRFGEKTLWYQASFGVGMACENQKKYEDAIGAYRNVVDRHSGSTAARAQFQIGECLFAQGKHEEAVRELLKVDILYAYPEWSAAALYEAGRCFEKLGKPAEAQAHFGQVAEKYKDTQWARLASQRLTELTTSASPPGT